MRPLFLTILLCAALSASAQTLPSHEGERQRYSIQIDLGKAYLRGVCVMLMQADTIKASIVNEFGVSFIDFTYTPSNGKVRLLNVVAKLDKWYIRRILRKDIRGLMRNMEKGINRYKGLEVVRLEV